MTDDTQQSGSMRVDVDLVRQLAAVLDDTGLTEIEVEDGARRVRVARSGGGSSLHYPPSFAAAAATAHGSAAASAEVPPTAPPPVPTAAVEGETVRSPMVGTAYLSADPASKAFVEPGQRVAAGDTLLIIEAMKVMNPILSPSAGRVTSVLVGNGQPVEFDQPLVVLA